MVTFHRQGLPMPSLPRLVLAASLAAALQACAVGPDYKKPPAIDPATGFHSAATASIRTAQSADATRWWNSFGDPTLAALVERAMQANLDLARAEARILQARAGVTSATASLAPNGAIDASGSRAKQSLETPLGRVLDSSPGFDRYGNLYEGDVSVGWDIDIFGGRRRERESALASYQAARAEGIAVRLAVQAEVARTYVTIRELQDRLAVAKDQVKTQEHLTSTIRMQFDAGVAPELQLRQTEGVLAQVSAAIPDLESSLEATGNALDVLLGQQPGTALRELPANAPVPTPPHVDTMDGPAGLLRRRPDIIAAERQLAAANANIGVAVAEYYPTFSLSALAGTATTTAGHQFTGSANQASAMLGLHWRLFDFGHIDADIKRAKGAHAEALANYRLTVLHASEEVEDSLTELVKREAQAHILAQGEDALTKAQTASRRAFEGGAVSIIEVLDADTRLLATRDARVRANAAATRAAISSFRALGGGWDVPPEKAP